MRKFLFYAVSFLISACLHAGTITGRVTVSPSNQPLAGVYIFGTVQLSSTAGGLSDTTTQILAKTDSLGKYTIKIKSKATYNLLIDHSGYETLRKGPLTVDTMSYITVDFSLVPIEVSTGSVIGKVIDAVTRSGVVGVQAVLGGGNTVTASYTALTDSNGVFQCSPVTPGSYILQVSGKGYNTYVSESAITVTAGNKTVVPDIALRPLVSPAKYGALYGKIFGGSALTSSVILPLPYASVSLSSSTTDPQLGYSAVADSGGNYAIKTIIPGIYTVNVSATGYTAAAYDSIVISADSARLFNAYLIKAPTTVNYISGNISDAETGNPLPGCTVNMTTIIPAGMMMPTLLFTASTDSAGRYVFKNIPSGSYTVTAMKKGYATNSYSNPVTVTADSRIDKIDITLKPQTGNTGLAVITGRVTAATASASPIAIPIAGATVAFWPNENVLNVYYSAVTDVNGYYKIADIKAGLYTATCKKEGYVTSIVNSCLIDTGSNTINFGLLPNTTATGWLGGFVTFEKSGKPAAGAVIDIISTTSTAPSFTLKSDSLGHYAKAIPAGKYIVGCTYAANGSILYRAYYKDVFIQSKATIIPLTAGDVVDSIDFAIPQLVTKPIQFTVKGTVTDTTGAPLSGALINISGVVSTASTDVLNTGGKTGSDGTYAITVTSPNAMPEFTFTVSASKDGYLMQFYNNKPAVYMADILKAKDSSVITEIDFKLESTSPTLMTHSISGLVTGTEKEPIAGAYVVCFQLKTKFFRICQTDSLGNYLCPNLKTGSYYMLFFKRGYMPQFYNNVSSWQKAQPVILNNSDITGIDAVLQPILPVKLANATTTDGMIAGIIFNPENLPVAGALITAVNSNGDVAGYSLSDAQGNYAIESLSEGTYNLTVTGIDYQTTELNYVFDPANGSMQKVDFALAAESTTSVEGTIRNAVTYSLYVYPNPFNPAATIQYSLSQKSDLTISVYNIMGQKVAILFSGSKDAGQYKVSWNPAGAASGIYFCEFRTAGYSIVKKMILMK